MGLVPRDDCPEPIALQFTSRSYEEMVLTAVAGLAACGGLEVTFKPHPRSGDDPIVRKVLSQHPQLAVRPAADGRLADLLARCDCVVSCGSSAGIDATLAGRPVIQVMPRGSHDMTTTDGWGLLGVAREPGEFAALLSRALAGGRRHAPGYGRVRHVPGVGGRPRGGRNRGPAAPAGRRRPSPAPCP